MNRWISTILCLFAIILTASTAAAQGPADDIPDGYEERCHSLTLKSGYHCHVVPAGSEPTWEPGTAGVIFMQGLSGLLGGAIIGVGGGYLTYIAAGGLDDEFCSTCVAAASIVGYTGIFLGMPIGVWLAGELSGGDGSFLWTVAGTFALGCLGAIGAYHISADYEYDGELSSYRSARPRLPAPRALRQGPTPSVTAISVPVVHLEF